MSSQEACKRVGVNDKTDGMPSMIAYLTRVLKTPTIGTFWEELAEQARDQTWSYEEYLAALLQGRLPTGSPRAP
nr:hypothetical protein [Catenulispora acidiphila]